MTTYYADFDLATGNNTGVDAANAWKTFADVLAGSNGTAPTAGDTVLCKGTDTLAGTQTVTIDGTYDGGYIKFIGVDASWANVGGSTRAVLDANGGAFSCLTFNGANYIWMENFRLTNTSKAANRNGVDYVTAYSDNDIWVNCVADNCYNGFQGSSGYARCLTFIRCLAHTNANAGFYIRNADYRFCRAYGNTSHGFNMYANTAYACISHDNGGDGFYVYSSTAPINCVAYGNTGDGFEFAYTTQTCVPIGCRAANNGTGVNTSANVRAVAFYYYGDNTTETAGGFDEILNDGASTVTLNGADTNEGFVDPSSDDYNLRSDATYRRVAVSIP